MPMKITVVVIFRETCGTFLQAFSNRNKSKRFQFSFNADVKADEQPFL